MTDRDTACPSETGDDRSFESSSPLTDAYHRSGSQPDTDERVFVLIFDNGAEQFHFHRGDSRAHVAARLQEFADRIRDPFAPQGG